MYLFLKIATSGLIRRELPLDDPQQPWAVAIAADQTDAAGTTLNRFDLTIKADGRAIKPGALEIHGISGSQAERFGVKENPALVLLSELAGQSQLVVSYAAFDTQVIDSLLLRLAASLGKPKQAYVGKWRRPGLAFLVMQDPVAKQECNLPHEEKPDELRAPKLDEACELLLGEPLPAGKQSTYEALQRTRRLFFSLVEKGHFQEVIPQ